MSKKIGAFFIALTLLTGVLASCMGTSGKDTITVWAAENVAEFTRERCKLFLEENPEIADKYKITVVAMGEGETASQMQTDVEAGADVYAFAQDQLGRLIRAGALSPLGGTYLEAAKNGNDPGSVAAATMGETMYAYPLTSDNGYMLYYDTSVVTDPTDLSAILSDCEAAGKKFYMDIRNGWYLVSFFFGAGCHYTTEVNEDGNIVRVDCDFNSPNGLKALKAMITTAKRDGFQQSTGFASQFNPTGGKAAAAVSGPWDAATIRSFLGDNYGVAPLPYMELDGETAQMSTWSGFKLMGVNPTQSEEAVKVSHQLAAYLTSEDIQLERYIFAGWGPSNLAAQQSEEVQSDKALSALREQMAVSPSQPQCSNNFWTKLGALGTEVDAGTYDSYTDAQLQAVLDELTEYLKNDVAA
ncbi:MAG: extracellular solute-binding protein [Clostridia bacterium]|nr:extracellular solute-binding protein [Clostridia bacterium]